MDEKLEKAIELAKRVHAGQVYRTPDGDRDYFDYHVWNVYNRLADPNIDGDAEIVTVLHDVLEDCKPEEKYAVKMEIYKIFGATIGLTLLLLDRSEADRIGIHDYQEYIERVATNELAAFVKIHDLQENICHCLMLNASSYAKNSLLPKYLKALNFLLEDRKVK